MSTPNCRRQVSYPLHARIAHARAHVIAVIHTLGCFNASGNLLGGVLDYQFLCKNGKRVLQRLENWPSINPPATIIRRQLLCSVPMQAVACVKNYVRRQSYNILRSHDEDVFYIIGVVCNELCRFRSLNWLVRTSPKHGLHCFRKCSRPVTFRNLPRRGLCRFQNVASLATYGILWNAVCAVFRVSPDL